MELSEQVSGTIPGRWTTTKGVRRVLTRWVADMGYAVQAADGAEKALEVMRDIEVDVALCDVRMPGHDGIWLIDQMRACTRTRPSCWRPGCSKWTRW